MAAVSDSAMTSVAYVAVSCILTLHHSNVLCGGFMPRTLVEFGGRKPRLALGPAMAGWGSWEWIGEGLAESLAPWFETQCFEHPAAVRNADVWLIVKHPIPDLFRMVGRSPVIYCPVDSYGSAGEIDADAGFLRRCARIVVHCEKLRRYFSPYAPVEMLDHPLKFVAEPRERFTDDGPILYVGVRTNLPPLAEWLKQHPLPSDLVVLTNPEDLQRSLRAVDYGLPADGRVRIETWSPARHVDWAGRARAALDIRAQDFRARHKPPAKALDYLASGLPLAMYPDSSPAEHLARMGFTLASPEEPDHWLSREYWDETRRFGQALRELLAPARVTQRARLIIDDVLSESRRSRGRVGVPSPAVAGVREGSESNNG